MSRVNFIEQFNLFMEYARENYIHGRECMLWMALFYFANKRAHYDERSQTYEWPDDFFSVSNSELNSYGQFDKRAIETLRNNLKQRGLIDFAKGYKNKRNPAYKMNYLVRVGSIIVPKTIEGGHRNIPDEAETGNFSNKNAPNYVPNSVPNNVPNSVPNNVPNSVPNNAPKTGFLDTKTHPKEINLLNGPLNADVYNTARAYAKGQLANGQSRGLVNLYADTEPAEPAGLVKLR